MERKSLSHQKKFQLLFKCGPLLLYPIWTAIALLYHLVAMSVDGYQAADKVGEMTANYFIYLPNWSYLLLTVYAFYDCVTALYVHVAAPEIIRRRESSSSSIQVLMRNKMVQFKFNTLGEISNVVPTYLKIGWALFTLAMPVALTVSITYWATYTADKYLPYVKVYVIEASLLKENVFDFGSLAFHLINGAMALLHICISAKPFRLLHFYFPLTFFIVYILFTLVYQGISSDYIYKSVDWDNTYITVSVTAGYLIFIPFLVHLLIHGIVHVRTKSGTWCQLWSAAKKIRRRRIAGRENNHPPAVVRKVSRRNSKVVPKDEDMVFEKRKQKQHEAENVENISLSQVSTVTELSE